MEDAKLDKTKSYTHNTYTTENNTTLLTREGAEGAADTILAEFIGNTDYIFGSIVLNIATTSDNPVNLSLVPMYTDDVEGSGDEVTKRDDYYNNHPNRCCVHIPEITSSQILTIPFMFNNHTINSNKQMFAIIAIKGAMNYSADTVSIVSCTYSCE